MKNSCVMNVPDDNYVVLKKSYLDICKDREAALLLSYFVGWHNFKTKEKDKNKKANDVAEAHNDPRILPENLFQHHTIDEIYESFMGLISKKGIVNGRKILVDLGFITEHKNPNPKYSFDKTVYYRLHPNKINQVLTAYMKNPDAFNPSGRNDRIDSVETTVSIAQNDVTDESNRLDDRVESTDTIYYNASSNIPPKMQASIGDFFSEVFAEMKSRHPNVPDLGIKTEAMAFCEKYNSRDKIKNGDALINSWCERVKWTQYMPQPKGVSLDFDKTQKVIQEKRPNWEMKKVMAAFWKIYKRNRHKVFDNPEKFISETLDAMERPDYVEEIDMTELNIIDGIRAVKNDAMSVWVSHVASKIHSKYNDKTVTIGEFREIINHYIEMEIERKHFSVQ